MKQHPILFSTPMVQAILNGQKTITRRIVKGTALEWLKPELFVPDYVTDPNNNLCDYGYAGDTLWVRETWTENGLGYYRFKADWPEGKGAFTGKSVPEKFRNRWKPSIHMPKKACRLHLEITALRIERLHDITEEDAINEGIQWYKDPSGSIRYRDYMADASGYGDPSVDYPSVPTPKHSFRTLWISINGKESWEANPWVWVITFKKITNE